jgi:hypothetical protein
VPLGLPSRGGGSSHGLTVHVAGVVVILAGVVGLLVSLLVRGPLSPPRLSLRIRPDSPDEPGRAEIKEAAAADVAAVLEDDRYFVPDTPGGGEGDFEPGFVIRVRDHRPVTASPSGPAAACAVAGVSWRGGLFAWAGRPVRGGGASLRNPCKHWHAYAVAGRLAGRGTVYLYLGDRPGGPPSWPVSLTGRPSWRSGRRSGTRP